jgi:hypothetical protein
LAHQDDADPHKSKVERFNGVYQPLFIKWFPKLILVIAFLSILTVILYVV